MAQSHADYDQVLYRLLFTSACLICESAGIVVLHDFFLSGVVGHMHFSGRGSDSWIEALYRNHGYAAVQQHFDASVTADVPWRYPCNQDMLKNAQGVIVHSESSRRLANHWISEGAADDCAVIPLLRVPAFDIDRAGARRRLKLENDDFVVCSFGVLGPHKLNQRLLNSWLASDCKSINCIVFVIKSTVNMAQDT
jgi:hypothetical protein